jgi:hypothetical protein
MAEKKTDILSPPTLGSPSVSHEEDIHAKIDDSSGSGSEAAAYAEHGPGIDHQITQENVIESQPELLWSHIRHYMRDPFSEFLGVFILILFGDGVVAQVSLSSDTKGDCKNNMFSYFTPPLSYLRLITSTYLDPIYLPRGLEITLNNKLLTARSSRSVHFVGVGVGYQTH